MVTTVYFNIKIFNYEFAKYYIIIIVILICLDVFLQ